MVRSSDFLVYDPDTPSDSSYRLPTVAFAPSTGLWTPVSSYDPHPPESVELWLRQVLLEFPDTLPAAKKDQVREIVQAGTRTAIQGVDCYKGALSDDCWTFVNQPTLNLSVSSLAFANQEAAKDFARNFAQLVLPVDGVVLAPVQRTLPRRGYSSFFSGRGAIGVQDGVDISPEQLEKSREELQSVRWMIFAVKAFLLRFWGLARVRLSLSCRSYGGEVRC